MKNLYCFFFQAEDGIRDYKVTGVQTCALPIWKQNGGTPPGWSHGNKTGWGCTPGSSGCMPPGLAKKAGNETPSSHTPRMATPVSHTGPIAHSGPGSHSPRTATPGSHTGPNPPTRPGSHTPVTTNPRPTPVTFR